jgi:hypothetical protein
VSPAVEEEKLVKEPVWQRFQRTASVDLVSTDLVRLRLEDSPEEKIWLGPGLGRWGFVWQYHDDIDGDVETRVDLVRIESWDPQERSASRNWRGWKAVFSVEGVAVEFCWPRSE